MNILKGKIGGSGCYLLEITGNGGQTSMVANTCS